MWGCGGGVGKREARRGSDEIATRGDLSFRVSLTYLRTDVFVTSWGDLCVLRRCAAAPCRDFLFTLLCVHCDAGFSRKPGLRLVTLLVLNHGLAPPLQAT